MINQQQYDEAISNITSGMLYDGFSLLVKIYENAETDEKNGIMAMMKEVFYLPNTGPLQDNYEKNRAILKEYPYWFGPEIPGFDELDMEIFPIDGKAAYLYNKTTDNFSGIEVNSDKETKYFFEDLSKPLLVEEESNEFNLRFLEDNVRASEDVAMDNHIYLYYKNPVLLYCVMQVFDMTSLLQKQKFVFLLGMQNKKYYLVNFKNRFQIDYKAMTPHLLRTEEMKRLTVNHVYGYTGTQFLCEIVNAHPEIIVLYCWFFHEGMDKKGLYDKYLECISDPSFEIDFDTLNQKINTELCTFVPQNKDTYISILKQISLEGNKKKTPTEWFKMISIAKYYADNGIKHKSRIVPIIYMDGHYRGFQNYNYIFQNFQYLNVLGCIRDPIVRYARCLKNTHRSLEHILNALRFLYKKEKYYSFANDFQYFIIKFEDLKLNTKPALKALCKILNIQMDNEMLYPERHVLSCAYTNEMGQALHGFDVRSMNRNIDDLVSDLDRLRYMLYLKPIAHLYGYDYKLNYEPASEEDLRKLFSLPFRIESLLSFKDNQTRLTFRSQYSEGLISEYLQAVKGEKYFVPQLIKPEEKKP